MPVRTANRPPARSTKGGKAEASRPSEQPSSIAPPLATIIGYKLRRAQLSVFQDFLRAFTKIKLRPAEFSVLVLIAETPGRKQTEIAERLGIKRANFVALMDGLERRGLAERRKADSDRRSHSVHLTPEGVRFVKKMTAIWETHESRLIERLGGPAAKEQLIALLDRMIDQPRES